MKLVTFRIAAGREARAPVPGVLTDGGSKVAALPGFASVLEIVEGGANALDRAHEMAKQAMKHSPVVLGIQNVTLLAPIPHPPQMRDFLCFEKHLLQAFRAIGKAPPSAWYERPIFYHPSRFSVCGPGAEVPWPAYTERLDFELEFGCYIGRPGKDIGPCLVTADEIGDPYRLEMVARVNGEEWGRGNSRDMHWKFEDCIAHASRSETMHPGEFFGSGTVGNGCGLEQLRFLNPGDVVELEVEGIGILRNRVVK